MPDQLTDDEIAARVRLPAIVRSPVWELGRRLLLAIAILGFTVALVYFDRDGYRDNGNPGQELGVVDEPVVARAGGLGAAVGFGGDGVRR